MFGGYAIAQTPATHNDAESGRSALIQLRKALIENESAFNNDYVSLMRNLFNFIDCNETNLDFKKHYLLTLSEYIYRSSFVVDNEINCYSCLLALADSKLTA